MGSVCEGPSNQMLFDYCCSSSALHDNKCVTVSQDVVKWYMVLEHVTMDVADIWSVMLKHLYRQTVFLLILFALMNGQISEKSVLSEKLRILKREFASWLLTRHPSLDQKAQSLLRATLLTGPLSQTLIWVTVLELSEVDEEERYFIRSHLAAGSRWQLEERSRACGWSDRGPELTTWP